jgi:hypothetical protein
MIWGAGSALGILAILGYAVFVAGAILLWSDRNNVPTWLHDEVGAIRRKVVRRVVSGGPASLREECRFKVAPVRFFRTLGRLPRRRINRGAILLVIGPLLMLLDLFL